MSGKDGVSLRLEASRSMSPAGAPEVPREEFRNSSSSSESAMLPMLPELERPQSGATVKFPMLKSSWRERKVRT